MSRIGKLDSNSTIECNGFIFDILMREQKARFSQVEASMHKFLNSNISVKRKIIEKFKRQSRPYLETQPIDSTPRLDDILSRILRIDNVRLVYH